MYFKVFNECMNQYGFQYKMGLNEDNQEFNNDENSFGLHFSDETSIMSFLEYGDDLIAEIEIPEGEPIVTFKCESGKYIKHKARRIIVKNIRPIWTLDTFKYLVEQCNVNMDYDDWLIDIAEINGCKDIADYLRSIRYH